MDRLGFTHVFQDTCRLGLTISLQAAAKRNTLTTSGIRAWGVARITLLYWFSSSKPTKCTNFSNLFSHWKSTCFGQFPYPSSGVILLYTQQWYMSYRFVDSLRAGSGCSFLILLASCLQTCMTHTFAVCTVKNSCWWLTEKLSETCRFSFRK